MLKYDNPIKERKRKLKEEKFQLKYIIIINICAFTFNPHTAKKSSLYGFPVIDKTIKGTGADAKRCKNVTVF